MSGGEFKNIHGHCVAPQKWDFRNTECRNPWFYGCTTGGAQGGCSGDNCCCSNCDGRPIGYFSDHNGDQAGFNGENRRLWINPQPDGERSDYAVGEVIVWDRSLTKAELQQAHSYMVNDVMHLAP